MSILFKLFEQLINSSHCLACSVNCLECDSVLTCLTCKANYRLNYLRISGLVFDKDLSDFKTDVFERKQHYL